MMSDDKKFKEGYALLKSLSNDAIDNVSKTIYNIQSENKLLALYINLWLYNRVMPELFSTIQSTIKSSSRLGDAKINLMIPIVDNLLPQIIEHKIAYNTKNQNLDVKFQLNTIDEGDK